MVVSRVHEGRPVSYLPAAIFLTMFFFQLVDGFIDCLKKKKWRTAEEKQLREEIKELLKEVSLLSTPSSFALAAKLQRTATAKQKELAKILKENDEKKASYGSLTKALMIMKMMMYLSLSWWFWKIPIAEVPRQYLQPIGKMMFWSTGNRTSDAVEVGIIPWLALTTRVSKLLSQKLTDKFI